MSRKKLLITGASGLLAKEIIVLANNNFEITGWVHSHPYPNPEFRQVRVNLFNDDEIAAQLNESDYDCIIHAAAISNTGYCQQYPRESLQINVNASFQLAQLAAAGNIPFIFISTDLVFDGKKGNYSEEDTEAPLNIYAQHKVMAEEKIRSAYRSALIIRVPWMLGAHEFSSSGYLKNFISDMKAGKKVYLFTDEFRSVVFASEAAKGILRVMNESNGILHLGGREKMSRYETGMLLAKRFSLNRDLIQAASLSANATGAPRPADVSLDSSKANQLGYFPKLIAESLLEFDDDKISKLKL